VLYLMMGFIVIYAVLVIGDIDIHAVLIMNRYAIYMRFDAQ
jgi:hypothetical protein